MKKQLLLFFTLCLTLSFGANAQTNVLVGAADTASYWPNNAVSATVDTDTNVTLTDGSSTGWGEDGRLLSWALSPSKPAIVEYSFAETAVNRFKMDQDQLHVISDFTVELKVGGVWVTTLDITGNCRSRGAVWSFTSATATGFRLTCTGKYVATGSDAIGRVHDAFLYETQGAAAGDTDIASVTDATVTSTAIEGVTDGTKVVDLYNAITTTNAYAHVEILNSDNSSICTDNDSPIVTETMKARVTSSNDTTKDYTIAFSAIFNISNITLNASCTVSSSITTSHSANYDINGVIDGNNSTFAGRWLAAAAEANTGSAWIEIDFGGTYAITDWSIEEEKQVLATYTFQSWDGAAWVTIEDNGGASLAAGGTRGTETRSFTEVTTTKVRLNALTTSGMDAWWRIYGINITGQLDATAGVEDYELSQFKLYPNPTTGDYININSEYEIESVKVFNIMGKELKSTLKGNRVDISTLDTGIYFIKINDTKTQKIIKN